VGSTPESVWALITDDLEKEIKAIIIAAEAHIAFLLLLP